MARNTQPSLLLRSNHCRWLQPTGELKIQIENLRLYSKNGNLMKLKVVVHNAEEGGYWAEVPAIPGCVTQADSYEDLITNLYEAIEGCLSIDITDYSTAPNTKILEFAV